MMSILKEAYKEGRNAGGSPTLQKSKGKPIQNSWIDSHFLYFFLSRCAKFLRSQYIRNERTVIRIKNFVLKKIPKIHIKGGKKMENMHEIIVRGNPHAQEKNNVSACIQRISEMFPVELKNRFRNNMERMVNYDWEKKKGMKKAMKRVKAMSQAIKLRMNKQLVYQYLEAEDIMFHDYSKKITKAGVKANLPVKHIGAFSLNSKSNTIVEYKKKRWRFVPLEKYNSPMPTRALEYANVLRDMGFTWDGYLVGKPVYISKDPILAISVGRWLIELFRWK